MELCHITYKIIGIMNQLVLFTILLQVFCRSTFGASKQKSKVVTTLIDAQWEVTPVVLEVAEFLAEENPDFMWSYIDNINSLATPIVYLETDRARYEATLREASFFMTPAQLSIMKLVLSLHIYSPKIEMHGQMGSERGIRSLGCPVAADVAGKLTCNVVELENLIRMPPKIESVETFSIDHHFTGSQNNTLIVVLYGEIGTPDFVEFHEVLKKHAKNGVVDYVLRHYVKERPNKKVRLAGYGVELQIKSTEYKAQDDTQVKDGKSTDSSEQDDEEDEIEGFNFNRLKMLYPDQKENLDRMRTHLLESTNEMAPLKVWQVQDLSLQAAERIMSSPPEEALKILTNIAQNFPLQARSLVRTEVSPELKKEMKLNQEKFVTSLNLQPSDTALFVNGMFFDLDVLDMMSLMEVFRQELRVMEGLYKNGITEPLLGTLLALDLSEASSNSQEYAIDIRDSAIMWVNDIEHDKQYRRWSNSLMELLRPTFPGMLRSVRRNLYNLVLIVDPSKYESVGLLKLAESFYVHTSPLRIGLVFAVCPTSSGAEDAGVALLNAFNLIAESKDPYSGLGFITDVYATIKEDRDVEVEDVRRLLKKNYPDVDVDEVLGEDSEYDTGRKLARDFIDRSGFRRTPQVLLNGIPLLEKQLNADDFEEAVLQEIMNQTPMYQKAVYKGEFTDGDNAVDYIMGLPNVMPRLNDRILNQGKSTYLDMSGSPSSVGDLDSFKALTPRDQTATVISKIIRYVTVRKHNNVASPKVVTHWIVCDPETPEGRQLLYGALEQIRTSGTIRVGILINPKETEEPQYLNKLILSILETLDSNQALQYLSRVLGDEALIAEIIAGKKKPSDIDLSDVDLGPADDLFATQTVAALLQIHGFYSTDVLEVPEGGRAVVTNGRVLGPLDDDERFTMDDFSLLERFCMNSYGDKIVSTLRKQDEEVENSDTLMQAVALLVARPQSKSRFEIPISSDDHSVLKLPARSSTEPAFEIAVIVDPVSRGAQKISHILSVLQEVLNCNIKVYLNCVEKNSDMPLRSFYRFVLEPELQFTADGRLSNGPIAKFTNLPASPLLTQNMHVPENWLVESVTSPYDLDNIRMEDVDSIVHSEFELEYLLLEGHCFEATYGNPPRGLQITLGTEKRPVVVDTIVMANLGYFQLKANPGAWLLRLRQGRSAEIYDIVNHEGSDTPANSSDIKVLISSFRSHVLKLRVTKKPDKANMDLLSEDGTDTGIWNSITSTFGGKQKSDDEGEEKINIFSLASGHLYERFLRIMMLSVLKHTKTPVKFWFLKNYLSPTLKDFLPHMAEEYGFEYELVQYKWPRWLHQQTEKQRIIWGYKILFLDVLFPLDVKKIIFVDADQVVRADLKELQDLDLGGAPYGYTPFCESRTDMDGFRFWKQGYWKNHLQGRRYHISALYVVDLKRFRRIAAGDRLRGQYQALSQDPNSLSNLDQDLPNNMIHQVAIKSLPQEWLWCETWCDEASKSRAKTIDLCNNPQTKEAKLSAAVRIVAEWRDYDDEVKRLQMKIDERHTEEGVDADPEHTVTAGTSTTTDPHKTHGHSEL